MRLPFAVRLAVWAVRALIALVCTALLAWMAPTIWFSPLEPAWLRGGLTALVPLGAIAALILVRPLRLVPAVVLGAFVVVLGAWLTIAPTNDADWQPAVATLPYADIRGDRVVVHNVRNNEYRTASDYTVRLEDRELDLTRVRSLDLFLIHWGSPWIAHTIMSFGFDDDRYLAFSIETRKKKGQSYSALRGFFRQYELIYVVADEQDIVRVRTNYRGEDVYLYRFGVPKEGVRLLLLRYLEAVNRLHDQPQWYNALTDNCTTTIQHLAGPYERRSWWSWKLLLNGRLDELAYDNGTLDQSLPFPELKALSYINERAKAAGDDPQFSIRIRAGLPRMTESPGP